MNVLSVVSIGCVLALGIGVAGASAQETLSAYGDTGDGLERFLYTDSEPFDIVIVANTTGMSRVFEFVLTELSTTTPGVFRINVSSTGNHIDMGHSGDDVLYNVYAWKAGVGECWEPGTNEILRLTYLDLNGTTIGADVVLSMRGIQEGDPWPTSFSGHTGYVECEPCVARWCVRILDQEAWSEYGQPDNEELAGAVVLNPSWFPIESDATSMGTLKVRY